MREQELRLWMMRANVNVWMWMMRTVDDEGKVTILVCEN